MAYCIEYSEYDPSKHKMVAGPWEDSCLECSFKSSSSSSSASGFYACARPKIDPFGSSECVEYELINQFTHDVVLGPFYGTDDCKNCNTSSSNSSSSSSSSSRILSCLECDPEKKPLLAPCSCWSMPMMTDDGIKIIHVPKQLKLNYFENEKICAEYYSGANDCFCDRTRNILVLSDNPFECEDFIDETPLIDGSSSCKCVYTRVSPGTFIGSETIDLWESESCDQETQTPINPKWILDEHIFIFKGCADEYYWDNNKWNIWIKDKTETNNKGEKIHALKLRIDKFEGPSDQPPEENYCEGLIWKKSCDGDACEGKYHFVVSSGMIIGSSGEKVIISKDGNFWKSYSSPHEGIVSAAAQSQIVVLAQTLSNNTVAFIGSSVDMDNGPTWSAAIPVCPFKSGKLIFGDRFVSTSKPLGQNIPAKSIVSDDGTTWSLHDMDAPYGADDIAWGTVSGTGKYLAVRSINSISYEDESTVNFQQFSVSEDGENWTPLAAPEFNRWTSATYANGKFVVFGMGASPDDPYWDGTSAKFAVSQNLVNWTLHDLPVANVLSSALSGTDDEDADYNFLIVMGRQDGLSSYGSDDGSTWTLINSPEYAPLETWQSVNPSSEHEGFIKDDFWNGDISSLTYYREKKWFAGITLHSSQLSPQEFEVQKIAGWDGCWSYGKLVPPEPYVWSTCEVEHPCFDGFPCPPNLPPTIYSEDSSWRDEEIDLIARYRREYDDYTFKEVYEYPISQNLTGSIGSSFGVPQSQKVTFSLEFNPTCRQPDTQSFCGNNCLGELYNFIDIETLDSYPMPPEECGGDRNAIYNGRPLDIDVTCGAPSEGEGDEVPGGVLMYFSPYTNTIPVINNLAYDTLSLPQAPPGKINVVLVKRTKTRNELRQWVCESLKFATVRNDWKTNPVTGSGSIGSDFTSPDQNVNFNWPYNDLYFSICPGGNVVNLVPC